MSAPGPRDAEGPAARVDTDVLVVGGGLAGTWAAWSAAEAGASVVLVDKGFCGTSGVTATAGVGHWWVPPAERRVAMAARAALGGGLTDEAWMHAILETTWERLPAIGRVLPFPVDESGTRRYRSVRGPEYLRAMRRLVQQAGVRILDHHPALELLTDPDGAVVGAAGVSRQPLGTWHARASAVILASGGCAFRSDLLGCHNNSGDGHLMAAELGVELSGMEFSSYYTVAPAHTTMTRSMSYLFADYVDADGAPLDLGVGPGWPVELARHLVEGPVRARLSRMPVATRERMPQVQPNFQLPFDRRGVDPYRDWFEVTLRPEGTIRGTGGLRVHDVDGSTGVPGLFAVGDVASRESVAGATSGGGAQNSAWALTSGTFAGRSAAARSRSAAATGTRCLDAPARPRGGAGLGPRRQVGALPAPAIGDLVAQVQAEVHPLEKNLFRTEDGLQRSLVALDGLWAGGVGHLPASTDPRTTLLSREVAAMTAVARWCYRAALARTETLGMHLREDHPAATGPARRLVVRGVDEVLVEPAPAAGGLPS